MTYWDRGQGAPQGLQFKYHVGKYKKNQMCTSSTAKKGSKIYGTVPNHLQYKPTLKLSETTYFIRNLKS